MAKGNALMIAFGKGPPPGLGKSKRDDDKEPDDDREDDDRTGDDDDHDDEPSDDQVELAKKLMGAVNPREYASALRDFVTLCMSEGGHDDDDYDGDDT